MNLRLKFNKKIITIIAVLLVLVITGTILVFRNKSLNILGNGLIDSKSEKLGTLTGQPCENAENRIITVMMASDPEARPLSGIGQADMVFEMPVTPNGITRMMAAFQCETPKEIGSIRSARQDFIPLADGLKSIYAHWGGEHGALEDLNKGIMDNIDALIYEGTAFYRKPNIPRPHNGFTNLDLLKTTATKRNYSLANTFPGYPHTDKKPNRTLDNVVNTINIPYTLSETWTYDQASNTYKRTRGGIPEIDKNTGEQVSSSVVIAMNTTSSFLRDQYIRVNVEGQGTAMIYQNGIAIPANWKKDPTSLDSKLIFEDNSGKEIELAPGKIWVQIITPAL